MSKLYRKQDKSMAIDYSIFWSQRAKETYFLVLDYLVENWSKREVVQFMNRVEIVLEAIKKNPQMYRASAKNKQIRKAHIDKNNSFFYAINFSGHRLNILTFYDNRQDPAKYKFQA
jgi:plasmid stabilization system protein ParE